MDATARENYLASQITTASPERLHLLLLEAAFRHAEQMRWAIANGQRDIASTSGGRCREILTELLAWIKRDGGELPAQMRSIYMFMIRELTEAQLRFDLDKADGVIKVLVVELDTWRELCERAADRPSESAAGRVSERLDNGGAAAGGPNFVELDAPTESFSMQA